MVEHVLDAVKQPQLIEVEPNLYVLRFESMKYVSADIALQRLLEQEVVKPGGTVVDSSSGIYALSLAMAAHKHGVRAHIMASTTVDAVTSLQLESLGATVERVPPNGTLKLDQDERVRRVHRYLEKNPDAHWMQQYHDPVHYLGYDRLGRELLLPDNAHTVDLIGAVGSGASTKGLRDGIGLNRECVCHAIQPFGSVTFGASNVPDDDMIIAGIGSAIQFDNVKHSIYETVDWISYKVAASATLRMYAEWGLFAGLSTGCGYLVAKNGFGHLRTPERPTVIVAPDTGHRYSSALVTVKDEVEGLVDRISPSRVYTPRDIILPWSRARIDEVEGEWDEFKNVVGD